MKFILILISLALFTSCTSNTAEKLNGIWQETGKENNTITITDNLLEIHYEMNTNEKNVVVVLEKKYSYVVRENEINGTLTSKKVFEKDVHSGQLTEVKSSSKKSAIKLTFENHALALITPSGKSIPFTKK